MKLMTLLATIGLLALLLQPPPAREKDPPVPTLVVMQGQDATTHGIGMLTLPMLDDGYAICTTNTGLHDPGGTTNVIGSSLLADAAHNARETPGPQGHTETVASFAPGCSFAFGAVQALSSTA